MCDVVDDERVIQRRLADVEGRLPENRRVQRSPADVLAVGEELVFGPHRAPVGLACCERTAVRRQHLHLLEGFRLGPLIRF